MENKEEEKDTIDKSKKDSKKKEEKGQSPNIDTEPTLNERVLNIAQRKKRAQAFRKNKHKILRARLKSMKKRASRDKLEKRAQKQAINIIRTKLSGDRSKKYADMSVGEKQSLDKKLEKKQAMIKKLAKRLMPQVKKAEQERFAKSKKVNEEFEQFFATEATIQKIDKLKKNVAMTRRNQEDRDDGLDSRQERNMDKKLSALARAKYRKRLNDIKNQTNSEEYKSDEELLNIISEIYDVVEADNWDVKRVIAKTIRGKHYKKALELLHDIMKRGTDKTIEYHAHDVARKVEGVDTKTLANMYKEKYKK